MFVRWYFHIDIISWTSHHHWCWLVPAKHKECVLYEVFLSVHYFLLLILAEFHNHSSYWLLHKTSQSHTTLCGAWPLSEVSQFPAGTQACCCTCRQLRGSVPNSWGWQRLPLDLPLLPSLGIPTCLPPSPWYGKIFLCPGDKKNENGLDRVKGRRDKRVCSRTAPGHWQSQSRALPQAPAQPSLSQMQLTQSRLEVIYCSLGVFSNCIFFSCQELTATARVLINGSCYLVHLKGKFRKHLLALLASSHNDSQANYVGHPVISTIVTGGKQMPREAGSKIMMYFTVFLLLTDLNKDLKCSVST